MRRNSSGCSSEVINNIVGETKESFDQRSYKPNMLIDMMAIFPPKSFVVERHLFQQNLNSPSTKRLPMKIYFYTGCLDVQLGSSPVSSLSVVSDGVVSLHSDPLRQRSVLLSGLSQLLLGLETLVSLEVSNCSPWSTGQDRYFTVGWE